MATLDDVTRALNGVRVVAQARIAIGETLTSLHGAYQLDISRSQRNALDSVRAPLESWFRELIPYLEGADYSLQFNLRKNAILKAYVEMAGVGATIQAKQTLSIVDSIQYGVKTAASGLGSAIKGATGFVGETAGGIVGGLLSGLGPIIVLVLALVIYATYFRKIA